MRVLITGGNGFIGKQLITSILDGGVHIPISGVRKELTLEGSTEIQTVELGNLEEKKNRKNLLKDIDVIIHTAARVHVMKENTKSSSIKYKKINVDATLDLARDAIEVGVKRFIFLSTIKVNGETTKGRSFTADDVPRPEGDYALSKFEAEQGLFQLSKSSDMEVVCIRPPLVYGKQKKGNLYFLIKIIKLKIPLPLSGAKRNKRSFVSINNLVDLLILCIDHPKAVNEVFLVSDGSDISTVSLIQLIANKMKVRARLFYFPPLLIKLFSTLLGRSSLYVRLFNNLSVDLEKTSHILSWKPKEDIESGFDSIFNK